MADRLEQHLVNIEKDLGGDGKLPPNYNQVDKLDWHLDKIESLLGGGVGGNVDDVKVNGESVLEDKVANINLKTINGEDVSGTGNIAITTYQAFPSAWPTDSAHTTKQFCDAIDQDETAVIGMGYFGGASWSDKPQGLANFDIVVEILDGPSHTKAIHLVGTSSSVYPYRWEYTYWSHGSVSDWRGVQPEVGINPTLSGGETSLTALQFGNTKYKIEQPIDVEANPTLAGSEVELAGLQVGSTKYKVVTESDVSSAINTAVYGAIDADY